MTFRELREQADSVADGIKIEAYRSAMVTLIQPNDVVISLGCGSGLLGMLALEAGAAKLVAVDQGPVVELARETFRVNGYSDRVVMHQLDTKRLDLPDPADVLLLDADGPFVPETGLSSAAADLVSRGMLRPDAPIVPAFFDLFVAPVAIPKDLDPVHSWGRNASGLNFSPFVRSAMNTPIPVTAESGWLLGPPVSALSRSVVDSSSVSFERRLAIETDGTLTGVLGFFQARLSPSGQILTSDLLLDDSSLRSVSGRSRHMYHPAGAGIEVKAGDSLSASFVMSRGRQLVTWRVRTDAQEVMGSTFLGSFIDPLSPRSTHR